MYRTICLFVVIEQLQKSYCDENFGGRIKITETLGKHNT